MEVRRAVGPMGEDQAKRSAQKPLSRKMAGKAVVGTPLAKQSKRAKPQNGKVKLAK
jgi:hypothetical protein